ncbi:MAG: DNA mismatch repair endonuclease MutL [Clostridia bacterium]|nr:DNA mismatch repair endonuclease MutL [Clostridia bacterium]
MGKIRVLPENVHNKIAAGEVVERPASVVKELAENAVDSGASCVTVSITEGGAKEITVCDNGCGMEPEDISVAFLRHATSKLQTADELFSIKTLGFRGEALAGIASVSRVKVVSKRADGEAYGLEIEGGNIGKLHTDVGNDGTTITVSDLFYNTPARKKFLKTVRGETAEITNLMSRLMMANPNVAFRYLIDGKQVLRTDGNGLDSALYSVYGKNTLASCMSVESVYKSYVIKGFIGKPEISRGNGTYQTLIINGRYVVNNTVSSAVKAAYAPYLLKRQYPFYVLHLTMPCEELDVNVHPNKLDVRFADRKSIFSCFYVTVGKLLEEERNRVKSVVHNSVNAQQSIPMYEGDGKTEGDICIDAFNRSAQAGQCVDKGEGESLDRSKEYNCGANAKVNIQTGEVFFDNPTESDTFGVLRNPTESDTFGALMSPLDNEVPFTKTTDITESRVDYIKSSNSYQPTDLPFATKSPSGRPSGLYASVSDILTYRYALSQSEVDEKRELADAKSNAFVQESFLPTALKYGGTVFETYLLLSDIANSTMYFVDQHAAHERILFDEFKKQIEAKNVATQPMLFPYIFDVNAQEEQFVTDNLPYLRECGFDISASGEHSFRIDGVPALLTGINLEKYVKQYLTDVNVEGEVRDVIVDKIAKTACVNAIKAGDTLNQSQIDEIMSRLQSDINLKCPHGRPLVVKVSRKEIEKWFLRIN